MTESPFRVYTRDDIFDEGMGYCNAKAVAMVRTQLPCVHTERVL
jgi:hypothetical protein